MTCGNSSCIDSSAKSIWRLSNQLLRSCGVSSGISMSFLDNCNENRACSALLGFFWFLCHLLYVHVFIFEIMVITHIKIFITHKKKFFFVKSFKHVNKIWMTEDLFTHTNKTHKNFSIVKFFFIFIWICVLRWDFMLSKKSQILV